ncbi:MAG: 30S ribosomal protein S8 [Bacteroidetes bacterium]|nr:30S ribosomal protein S8 [Bacteroidota bacterium]
MYTDPISDFLTRIRNAIMANHEKVLIPSSNLKNRISKVLLERGYIKDYKTIDDKNNRYGGQQILEIELKYATNYGSNREYAITKLDRKSKPGLRKYSKVKDLPHVLNGLGIAILSTSKGVITDKEARKLKIGGEVLCHVY